MSAFKRVLPLLNRIVIRRLEPQTKTTSGIIINKAESANYGVVIEAGPGSFDSEGKVIPVVVKIGDTVLLPEFGGQKIKLGDQELFIFRDSEIVARVE
jgi:chaperonin GroES